MARMAWLRIWIVLGVEVKIRSCRLVSKGVTGQLRWLVAHLTVLALPPLAGRWRGISKSVKRIREAYFPIGWKVAGW